MKVGHRKNEETGEEEIELAWAVGKTWGDPSVQMAILSGITDLVIEKMAERYVSDHYREFEAKIDTDQIINSLRDAIAESIKNAVLTASTPSVHYVDERSFEPRVKIGPSQT